MTPDTPTAWCLRCRVRRVVRSLRRLVPVRWWCRTFALSLPAPFVPGVRARCVPLVVPLLFLCFRDRWPGVRRRPRLQSQTFSDDRDRSRPQDDTLPAAGHDPAKILVKPTCDRNPRCVLHAPPKQTRTAPAAELAARPPIPLRDKWPRSRLRAHPPAAPVFLARRSFLHRGPTA